MSMPIIGEIKLFSFNWAPVGWLPCQGQSLQVAQNQALFSLISFNFGGNGSSLFALPDLQGVLPMGQGVSARSGSSYVYPKKGGQEQATLAIKNLAPHNHSITLSGLTGTSTLKVRNTGGTTDTPAGDKVLAKGIDGSGTSCSSFAPGPADTNLESSSVTTNIMGSATVDPTGGGQAFSVMPPYLVLNYCIATEGIYPQRP